MNTVLDNQIIEKNTGMVALILIGILLAGSVVTGFLFQDSIKTTIANIQTDLNNRGEPKFVFNTAKFPDWATAGNVYANPDDSTDDSDSRNDNQLVSGINITQCKSETNCSKLVDACKQRHDDKAECKVLTEYTTDTHCMVSAYYSKKPIDTNKAVASEREEWSRFSSGTPYQVGLKKLTIDTPDGNKEYQLYQYDTNNKDTSYKRGSAFGFIPLSDGHIEVRSVCWEASQLDETLPILSAIALENN